MDGDNATRQTLEPGAPETGGPDHTLEFLRFGKATDRFDKIAIGLGVAGDEFEASDTAEAEEAPSAPEDTPAAEETPAAEDVAANGTAATISDYEFASRLAIFLWCSVPDDELLKLAEGRKKRKGRK